jgi:hypothetical protein
LCSCFNYAFYLFYSVTEMSQHEVRKEQACIVLYFSIDDAYSNIFITPFWSIDNAHMPTSGRVRKYRQRTEEFFKSMCIASSNSSNIESDEYFFGFE